MALSFRSKLTNIPTDADPVEILWTCGDDVPVYFNDEYLKQLSFATVKKNLRSGAITEQVYKELMAFVRAKNKY